MQNKKIIPVFYSADDNYVPFLQVSVLSLKEHRTADKIYRVHVLNTGISEEHKKSLLNLRDVNLEIEFNDVSSMINKLTDTLELRDYYTYAIYYRLFIADLFKCYDKAVYLDCDTAIISDIAELYETELGDNLIAGVPDGAVSVIEPFQVYTKKVLGINANNYFNSGVIVMNLDLLRKEDFYNKFTELFAKYKFRVAPDQDCLNLVCKDRVTYLGNEWNAMPIRSKNSAEIKNPKLIHYNLTAKPWHYSDLPYEDFFWEYAKRSDYYEHILTLKSQFTDEDRKKDSECEKGLIALTIEEAENPDNYFNKYCK